MPRSILLTFLILQVSCKDASIVNHRVSDTSETPEGISAPTGTEIDRIALYVGNGELVQAVVASLTAEKVPVSCQLNKVGDCQIEIIKDECNGAAFSPIDSALEFSAPAEYRTCFVEIIGRSGKIKSKATIFRYNIVAGDSPSLTVTKSDFLMHSIKRPVAVNDEIYITIGTDDRYLECKLPDSSTYTTCSVDETGRLYLPSVNVAGELIVRSSNDKVNWQEEAIPVQAVDVVACGLEITSGTEPTYAALKAIIEANEVVCFGDGVNVTNQVTDATNYLSILGLQPITLIARVGDQAVIENKKSDHVIYITSGSRSISIVGLEIRANNLPASKGAFVSGSGSSVIIADNSILHRGNTPTNSMGIQANTSSKYRIVGNQIRAFSVTDQTFGRGIFHHLSDIQYSEYNTIESRGTGITFDRFDADSGSWNDVIISQTNGIEADHDSSSTLTIGNANITAGTTGLVIYGNAYSMSPKVAIINSVIEAGSHGLEVTSNGLAYELSIVDTSIKRSSSAGTYYGAQLTTYGTGTISAPDLSSNRFCHTGGLNWNDGAGSAGGINDTTASKNFSDAWNAGTQLQLDGPCN